MKTMETDRYGALEKCRAVLAVWTERQQASALCRELGVSASLFSQWQDRAVGYAGGAGAAGNANGFGRASAVGADQTAAGPQGAYAGTGDAGPERELAPPPTARQDAATAGAPDRRGPLNGEVIEGERATRGREDARPAAGNPGGAGGANECHAGGPGTGDQPQDVLRMAGAGALGDAGGAAGSAGRPAAAAGGPGEGQPAPGTGDGGAGAAGAGGPVAHPGGDPGNVERTAAGAAA